MSWGTRIAILYVGFVLGILALVFRTSQENTDLVAEDYYNKELKFQDQIDGQNALLATGQTPVISVSEQGVHVVLPAQLSGNDLSGTISFYRADDAKKDRTYALTAPTATFPQSDFVPGLYTVSVKWSSGGSNYDHETSIYFP